LSTLSAFKITNFLEQIDNPYMFFVITDKEGRIINVNQTFLDLIEAKKEDVENKHILDVIPDSKLPAILETGRPNKADIWSFKGQNAVVNRLPIWENGEIIGAIGHGLFLDISAAKILVEKLQEKEKEFNIMLEGLIESPHMGYAIVDKEGFITAINQTYLELLGLKKESTIGKHILDVTSCSKLHEVLQTGRIDKADIYNIKGQDIVVNRFPIQKEGEIIGAICQSIFLDLSGVNILMEKLKETENELNIYKDEVCRIYQAKWQFEDLIGESDIFHKVKTMAQQLANTTSTVLITGESGTGKELFAQAIHNASSRRTGPFIRINCAALPENLLESELFGYEEGAFTGAKKGGKPGKFELAKGGTVFLDEIGDMPLNMQTKLLSVLQERVIERVGGTEPIPINVRVIAATNQDLEQMVKNKQFRSDLYYRLNVVRLNIPPLRKRTEDLPLLVEVLMARINKRLRTRVSKCSKEAIKLLAGYSWPGNVRELENLLERAINLANANNEYCIRLSHLPSLIETNDISQTETNDTLPEIIIPDNFGEKLSDTIEGIEKKMILQALSKTGGNKTKTAKLLGIHNSALYRKLSKYGLD